MLHNSASYSGGDSISFPPPHFKNKKIKTYGRGKRGGEGDMHGKSNMETMIILRFIHIIVYIS